MDYTSIESWFGREVLRWRTGASVTWSVLGVPVLGLIYALLSSLQIFQPIMWLYAPLSFSFIRMMFFAMITQCVYLVYSSKTFTVIPSVSVTRLSQLLQAQCLMYTALCVSCGCVLAWICTNIVGGRYGGLSYKCGENSEVYCINEYHLFLVLYGGYTGLMYVVYHYVRQNNVLHFPALQQAKHFQVRCQIYGVAWKSLGFIIWQVKFYYIAYYFLGNLPRDWIANTLDLKFGTSYRLDSLYGLILDLRLLWQTILIGLFVQISWSCGGLLYNVYITEHYEFLISSMFENYKNKCLVDAMSCINNRLIQALGFHDLMLLSKYSYTRRKELFSLSQPGGHPHNWNKILAVCLTVIDELNDSVKESNWKILANAPVRHPSTEKSQPQDIHSITSGNATMNGMKDASATSSKPVMLTIREKIFHRQQYHVFLTLHYTVLIFEYPEKEAILKHCGKGRNVMGNLKRRGEFLQFFKTEAPEIKNRHLFSSAFLQIWAVEALSSLVAASFKEDSYGVVQMSLKEIVISILSLQENVEKNFKLTGGIGRRVQKDQSANEQPWKYLLHTTLKNSMYKIVNTFGKHLLEIGFPSDVEMKLHHFLEYRE